MTGSISRRLAAEFIGTTILLATVVGSGIMGENLAGGNMAIALLGNTIATGAILVVLILVFGSISGAHFNPAVTLAFLLRREISPGTAFGYIGIQIVAGISGTILAHIMFAEPALMLSTNTRNGLGQCSSNHRPHSDKYFFRYCANGCTGFHHRPNSRRCHREGGIFLAS